LVRAGSHVTLGASEGLMNGVAVNRKAESGETHTRDSSPILLQVEKN